MRLSGSPTASGARNYAIVFTMLDAGLRATELLELTVANARLQEGFLKVLGKGNKERLIPIGRRCQDALHDWRDRFRPQFDETGEMAYVFLNANGQRMTLRALEEMIGRTGKLAGITGLHPHRLRHTFATRFLTEGLGDTFQLQQLLGHTSLEMVRRYVSIASVRRPSWSIGPQRWTDSEQGNHLKPSPDGSRVRNHEPCGLFARTDF